MEVDPELIELKTSIHSCIHYDSGWTCFYMHGRPGASKCVSGITQRPCENRDVIFISKLEYLTWKLTRN